MAAVEGAVEVVAEAAEVVGEEALEAAEVVRAITGRDMGLVFLGSCVGLAGGLLIGRSWMKKNMELKIDEIVDQEVLEMRKFYQQKLVALEGRAEKETMDKIVEEQNYATQGDGKVPYHKMGSEPDKTPQGEDIEIVEATPQAIAAEVEARQNVFEQEQPEVATPEWDYNIEVKSRKDKTNFVIHRDEYMENAWEYEQYTLTYFEGDDVLSDSRDQVVADQDKVVGLENLSKFGHGSNDPDIVYVCNIETQALIEVVHSDGRYATEVHGFTEDEIQHSSVRRRPPRRSRYDDSD